MFILQLYLLICNFLDMKIVPGMAGTPEEKYIETKIYICDIVRLTYVWLFKEVKYNLLEKNIPGFGILGYILG